MRFTSLSITAIALLCSTPAFALDNPIDMTMLSQSGGNMQSDFDSSSAITMATLSSTVSNSNVTIQNVDAMNQGGNTISGGAFSGAFGIMAVNQNTGANSNAQQSVVFKAENINLNLAH